MLSECYQYCEGHWLSLTNDSRAQNRPHKNQDHMKCIKPFVLRVLHYPLQLFIFFRQMSHYVLYNNSQRSRFFFSELILSSGAGPCGDERSRAAGCTEVKTVNGNSRCQLWFADSRSWASCWCLVKGSLEKTNLGLALMDSKDLPIGKKSNYKPVGSKQSQNSVDNILCLAVDTCSIQERLNQSFSCRHRSPGHHSVLR